MKNENPISRFKYKTFLLLVLVYVISIWHEQLRWVWGILFLLWVIPNIISGRTHLAESITRSENPIWYWIIIVTWIWMSLYLVVEPFVDWNKLVQYMR